MSLIEQARELLKKHPKRSDFIAHAVADLQMSQAGAATYWQHLTSPRRSYGGGQLRGIFGQGLAFDLAIIAAVF